MLSQFNVAALDPFTRPAVSAGLSDGFLQQHLAESDMQMQWNDLHYGRCVCKTRDTQNSSDRVQPIEVGKFMKHKYVFLPVYKLQWNAHTRTNIGADLRLDRAP